MSTLHYSNGGAYVPKKSYARGGQADVSASQPERRALAAAKAFTSNTTLADLSGFVWPVQAGGVYYFNILLPTTMTTNGGISVAFNYSQGASLSNIQVLTYAATASDNTTAVSTQSTTTTTQTKFIDTTTAAYTYCRLEGSLSVSASGFLSVQAAQNSSHADTTTVLLGATAMLVRVA